MAGSIHTSEYIFTDLVLRKDAKVIRASKLDKGNMIVGQVA